jgi:alkyl sulfatase BDS1-like metallo-beta-lactamase superfamily hydrolase
LVAGLPLRFNYIPGYTEDQLAIWFPTTKLLVCADSFYSMLPNIYTIRGEPARDALAWSKTVRLLKSYNAEVLYPSHLDPIYGRDYIADILEKVADSIQYIHDQTVRLSAKGFTPDAVSGSIQLPDSLQNEPMLAQV